MAEPRAADGVAPSDLGSYQYAVRLVLTNDLITAARPRAGALASVLRWADLSESLAISTAMGLMSTPYRQRSMTWRRALMTGGSAARSRARPDSAGGSSRRSRAPAFPAMDQAN